MDLPARGRNERHCSPAGRYSGRPVERHRAISGLGPAHFDRWLELFEETARELCPPAAATHFVELARRIAASLELGIAGGQGVMLAPGERFRRNETGALQ